VKIQLSSAVNLKICLCHHQNGPHKTMDVPSAHNWRKTSQWRSPWQFSGTSPWTLTFSDTLTFLRSLKLFAASASPYIHAALWLLTDFLAMNPVWSL